MTGIQLFTLFHVAISVVGIVAGLVVIWGFLQGLQSRFSNLTFLAMTILTSVTGFFFPYHGVTPGIVIGVISLVILALAVAAYRNGWTKTYIATATAAEFFNVLVLIVQLFEKVGFLHQLAPTGKEPIVSVVQLVALVALGAAGWIAIRRTRSLAI